MFSSAAKVLHLFGCRGARSTSSRFRAARVDAIQVPTSDFHERTSSLVIRGDDENRPVVRNFSASARASQHTVLQLDGTQSQNATIEVQDDGRILEVTWRDNTHSRYHGIWLRHNCQCSDCKQAFSGQSLIEVSEIDPSQLKISNAKLIDDMLEVEWDEGQTVHHGKVPIHLLHENCYSEEARRRRKDESRIKQLHGGVIPRHCYHDIVKSDTAMLSWLQSINDYGLAVVTDIPLHEGAVVEFAELVSPVQFGIYGKTYDIKYNPEPINIAYSSVPLGFHTDYIYLEAPLGVHLLHCLRFDPEVKGGESIFVDAFLVAEELREKHPDHFETLVRVPATFQKIHVDRDFPVYMKFQTPTITVNHEKEIVAVRWGPYFEAPLQVAEEDVLPYYQAQHVFGKLLQQSETRLKYRLQPGECVTFNNRRLLHGREGFTLNGGMRFFKGCYLNIDEVKSKTQLLMITEGTGKLAKRVGNHCFL
ncbi:gamma-butyrobetaine dioxygenase-like [Ptychodera flava]|uniref:gamma-butyrobetaine dioxygenase-like n=1 Tax=Ptychodera flava TaxID=63121 RepID=UPI003969C8D6